MSGNRAVESNGCRIEARLERASDSELRVSYTLENTSGRNVYVFDGLYSGFDAQGSFVLGPNLAWVAIGPKEAVVSRSVPSVPDDLDVERPIVPLATRVGPGGRHEASFQLALPLEEHLAYDEHAPGPPPGEEIRELPVVFELGFFVAPPEADALPTEVETALGPRFYFSPFPESGQTLARLGPFEAVAVRSRVAREGAEAAKIGAH